MPRGVVSTLVLAVAVACSSSNSPPEAPPDPRPAQPVTGGEQAAVALGVSVDAHDAYGAPRLIRAVVPRSGAAGMTPDEAARDHVAALAPLWVGQGRASDLTTRSVQRLRNGASIVRLQQQQDQIDFHQGELRVLIHPDGSFAAAAGTLRPRAGRAVFRSSPEAAVERALDVLVGASRARPVITSLGERAGHRELAVAPAPGFAIQHARVKPEIFVDPQVIDKATHTVWSVELIGEVAGAQVARRYLIADADQAIVRDANLIASDAFVYRAFAETVGNRTPLDGALESFAPHPTGTPDGSVPQLGPYNLVVAEAFNGPHDPWLGPTATTTEGNNVTAIADITPPVGFNDGDIRPEVRSARVFNFRYDFAAEPLATPDQSKAAAVNVFFVTNWLHDWYYDSGFTEATGNAQLDNFDRGGIPGDPLLARAQADASLGVRDNASMVTPADGLSPRMNMFLFTGVAERSLTTATAAPATAAVLNSPRNFDVTAPVVVVDDASGGHSGCAPVTNAVAGQLALSKYQFECPSQVAIENIKAAGAAGVILMMAFPGFPALTQVQNPADAIPAIVIGFDDGTALETSLPTTATLHQGTTIEHDSAFDNALIAHEWGHYLHHRLSSCEITVQCAAMSEGWGDFIALQMMLRPSDNRDGTFGVGSYALTAGGFGEFGFQDPGYFGIRRYPYSIDRTRNALSLRHISDASTLPEVPTNPGPSFNNNAEVHNAGEVWAAQLWDAYIVLIDEHGFAEARRRMSDYVVAGMLLNPPEATFIEGRDALLAAAGALDTDDMVLMAAAFAGRGAGTCAVAPPNTSFSLNEVVESGTIAARLATGVVTLSDDGASCDRDGYLDPGESGTLRLTVANSGVIPAEGVVVTARTTATGVIIGQPVRIGAIAALAHVDVEIPVRVAATAPRGVQLDIDVEVVGDAGCNTGRRIVGFHERMGVDEVPNAGNIDNFETRRLAWTPTGALAGELWGRIPGNGRNHVLFGIDATVTTDTQVVSPVLQVSPTVPLVVTLNHAYNLEFSDLFNAFFDGGVVEVSSDGGTTWRDVTAVNVDPKYPAVISPTDAAHPLRGRLGFSGISPSFPALRPLVLNFGTQFAGQEVQLRFRLGTDACCTGEGWTLDDVVVTGITNRPFPALIRQPTACTAPTPAPRERDDGGVIAVRAMPRASLDGVAGANEP